MHTRSWIVSLVALSTLCVRDALAAQSGACLPNADIVLSQHSIANEPSLASLLANEDHFGKSSTAIGDINQDGVPDLVVGASQHDLHGSSRGAIFVLLMTATGGVSQVVRIGHGSLNISLADGDGFGHSIAFLGALDCAGQSRPTIAVGAVSMDDGAASDAGAVWILKLDSTGNVACADKISGLPDASTCPNKHQGDLLGQAVVSLGDFDGAGPSVVALAIGAPRDDDAVLPTCDPTANRGAIWVVYLDGTGQVMSSPAPFKIYEGNEGFNPPPPLSPVAVEFGLELAAADFNLDGTIDLAVGHSHIDAVWMLSLSPQSPHVASVAIIDSSTAALVGSVSAGDSFGSAVTALHWNDDLIPDLAVGALNDDDALFSAGALWLLTLDGTSNVVCHDKISSRFGGLGGAIAADDEFGFSVSTIDLNGDQRLELVVGAAENQFMAGGTGETWILFREDPLLTTYCFGNGARTACPCGNDATALEGCKNSSGAGAKLFVATGGTSVVVDDLVLTTTGMPLNKSALFFMGGAHNHVPFGDGLFCAKSGGFGLLRYGLQNTGPFGTISIGPVVSESQNLPPHGHIDPGETWHFQAWYRDPLGPCAGTFNLSNALKATFVP